MNVLRASLVLAVLSVSAFSCGGGSSSSSGGPKMCAPANTTCTAAETKKYSDCVLAACDSVYKSCLGSGYKSGNYSGGMCGDGAYFKCQQNCPCNDTQCIIGCGLPDMACITCLSGASTCSSTCTAPACYSTTGGTGGRSGGGTGGTSGGGTGGASGGGTGGAGGSGSIAPACMDILTCCNASTNATVKAACMQQYDAIKSSDNATCMTVLATLKQSICP